jgi:hypothetical protein
MENKIEKIVVSKRKSKHFNEEKVLKEFGLSYFAKKEIL